MENLHDPINIHVYSHIYIETLILYCQNKIYIHIYIYICRLMYTCIVLRNLLKGLASCCNVLVPSYEWAIVEVAKTKVHQSSACLAEPC